MNSESVHDSGPHAGRSDACATGHLFHCAGGNVLLPARGLCLVDRGDGGNLVVNPPRPVWERSELSAGELQQWGYLVAATGRAMIDVLPQLQGGCVNYWEAGNWALNDAADPKGPKEAPRHRSVHLHLLGRSRTAKDPSWQWGEAPQFPPFAERHSWAARFERLTGGECCDIVARTAELLRSRYGSDDRDLAPWTVCSCGYPHPSS